MVFEESSVEFPRRIVCLSDESAEVLYLLGEQERIVGVSGFSTRPPEVRSKPRVSAFREANLEAILALRPELVLTFSDVQAEITRNLVLRGVAVLNFNQRSLSEIFDMIAALSRLVGKQSAGLLLVNDLRRGLERIEASACRFPRRPRVFFEEWNDPLISGIEWVEELVEIAGGTPLFPELRRCGKAQDRVVDPCAVAARDPEVILASWCGMKVDRDVILSRPGFSSTTAGRQGNVFEIPSSIILQPGPGALTEGLDRLHTVLAHSVGIFDTPAPQRDRFGSREGSERLL